MAKKKVAVKKVKPTKKAAKSSAGKSTRKKAAKATKKAAAAPPSLGRPLVTMEEKLYMLFHEDYEARQIFEFLRVETVGDLIRLSPEEIVRVLTAPVRRTINRIRERLADKNRSLQGDEEFTRQHLAKSNSKP